MDETLFVSAPTPASHSRGGGGGGGDSSNAPPVLLEQQSTHSWPTLQTTMYVLSKKRQHPASDERCGRDAAHCRPTAVTTVTSRVH